MDQLRKSYQEYNSAVPGIHLKVEQDLRIIQNSIADIVGFVDDDDRSFLFIQGKPCDLVLDGVEIFRLPLSSLGPEGESKIPIKVIHRYRRKARIDDFVERWIQLGSPVTDECRFASPRRAGQKAEAFDTGEIIKAE